MIIEQLLYLVSCIPFRKSSGFSRGASIYRGVTRSGHLYAIEALYLQLYYAIIVPVFVFKFLSLLFFDAFLAVRYHMSYFGAPGIINRVDGKRGLAALPETKTCTLEHLVSKYIRVASVTFLLE